MISIWRRQYAMSKFVSRNFVRRARSRLRVREREIFRNSSLSRIRSDCEHVDAQLRFLFYLRTIRINVNISRRRAASRSNWLSKVVRSMRSARPAAPLGRRVKIKEWRRPWRLTMMSVICRPPAAGKARRSVSRWKRWELGYVRANHAWSNMLVVAVRCANVIPNLFFALSLRSAPRCACMIFCHATKRDDIHFSGTRWHCGLGVRTVIKHCDRTVSEAQRR